MKKGFILAGVLALIGALFAPFVFAPSDEQMIKDALNESIKAGREGRPGVVMEYVSRSFKYNDEEVNDRMSMANYIKSAKPEVTVLDPRPTIQGNTATIVSAVDVNLAIGPVDFPVHLDHAEITFAKETGTKFLIFPSPTWRITNIKAEAIDLSQLEK